MGFDLGSIGNLGNMGALMDVWNKLQSKDWSGLFKAIQDLRSEKGDSEGLQQIETAGRQAESEGHDFPSDPSALAKLITSKL